MSKLVSILLSPYNFSFSENGIFASSIEQRRRSNRGLQLRLHAFVLAIVGLLSAGELHASNTPIQNSQDDPPAIKNSQDQTPATEDSQDQMPAIEESKNDAPSIQDYKDELEEISQKETKLKSEFARKLKLAEVLSESDSSDAEISALRNQLFGIIESKQNLLRELSLSAPEEPKYLFELAQTHLAKSKLTLSKSAPTKELQQGRLTDSQAQKNRGIAIMQLIAQRDKPGYIPAHLFLAAEALKSQVTSSNQRNANLRLANLHLDNVLIQEPENTTALKWKIKILQTTKQLEEMKKFLEILFVADPSVYPEICKVNTELGVESENAAVLRSAQQRLSDQVSKLAGPSEQRTRHVTYLVDCLHRLEKLDEADERVESEMAGFPDNAEIQTWGNRLLAIGQELRYRAGGTITSDNMAELVGYLREGHRLDPNNVTILNNIVNLVRFDLPGIEKISNDIYQPGTRAPASVENILGFIAFGKGEYLEAAKRFSKANAKSPNNPEYLNNLASVYLARPDPDPEQALKLVDRAINSVQSGSLETRHLSNFYDTKGQALLALGKIDEANGDQELADSRYSMATAKLLAALALVDTPANLPAKKRCLKISQTILECYEVSNLPKHAKVWRERVKELQAGVDESQAD